MKKTLSILLVLMSLLTVTAQKSTLNVTLKGLNTGVQVVVCEPQSGRLVPVDTVAPDSKGFFQIKREGADPQFFAFGLTQRQSPMLHILLLPKEKVTMDVTYEAERNVLRITDVKGSENMDLYRRFNNSMADAAVDPSLQTMIPDVMETLLANNSSHLMSAFLVTFFETAFEQYAYLYKQIRDDLVIRYPDNEFVRHLNDKLRNAVVAGMEAPDIALEDRNGNIRRLSDLRGKVVLIDFWASWCRPCRAENPNVVRIYKQFRDKGFEVFSVSLDNNREKWLQAIEADGLEWENHVSDLKGWKSAGGQLYGISSIPATVLVDRDGKVVARNLRGQELENKLNEIFAQ